MHMSDWRLYYFYRIFGLYVSTKECKDLDAQSCGRRKSRRNFVFSDFASEYCPIDRSGNISTGFWKLKGGSKRLIEKVSPVLMFLFLERPSGALNR